jgi:outer membrane protein assembly factor BamA
VSVVARLEKEMMRVATIMVLVAGLAGVAAGQDAKTPAQVHVRKLVLTSKDTTPPADLATIAASLEGGTFALDELQDRVALKLHDEGYYFASAENPQLTHVQQAAGTETADVALDVTAGTQYQMGKITFRGTKEFNDDKLRGLFPVAAGSLYSASGLATGLDKLKSLYEGQGFADVGAVPDVVVNEAQHSIDVIVQVEEGNPYTFGPLTITGSEPSAGAGKTLLAAWKQLEGKRYNPELLKKWLAANAPKNAAGAPPIHPHAEGVADPDAHLMDVRLSFE